MEDKKLFGRTCPKCGEIYQSCELVKVHLGAGVQANMQCPNNHKWTEFYTLDYQGYWWDGKIYDSYGEPKDNKNK
jgi:hypothetical protein